jgi:hypothetical protein
VVTTWDNRIVGYAEEPPDQLLASPFNFRRHPKAQQEALSGVLSQVGWIQNVIVNRTTGHIIDGHLRVEESLRQGAATVPVVYVDLTPDEEKLALAVFDPLAAMAYHDAQALDDLMRELVVDDPAVVAMLADLAGEQDAYAEPPPPPGEDRYKEQYGVIVICRDAAHQETVYSDLQAAGHECRVVVT